MMNHISWVALIDPQGGLGPAERVEECSALLWQLRGIVQLCQPSLSCALGIIVGLRGIAVVRMAVKNVAQTKESSSFNLALAGW